MIIIEFLFTVAFILLGIITSISDVREGRIYNKTLLGFVLPGIVLCVIYYGYFARDLFWLFMINFGIIAFISLILFYTHSFAGGDCKLTLVMALLYPANEYLVYGKSDVTLYFALCLAILYGYFYLLYFSIYSLVNGRTRLTREYVKGYLENFLKSFLSASGYICLINLFFCHSWLVWDICQSMDYKNCMYGICLVGWKRKQIEKMADSGRYLCY